MIGAGFIGAGAQGRRRRARSGGTISAAVLPATSELEVGQSLAETENWAVFTTPANYTTTTPGETIADVTVTYTGDTGSPTAPLQDGDTNSFSVTVTDTGGLGRTFFTQPRSVQYGAPLAAGGLADLSFTAGTGVVDVDVSGDFSGAGLSYAVTGSAAVTIDAATGLLRIDTDALAPVTDLAVVVTASNSGGSAQSGFGLTIEAAPTAPAQMAAPGVAATGSTLLEVTLAADPDDGGAAIVRRDLRWRITGGSWTTQTGVTSPVTLEGLTPDTSYQVRTRVVNAVGNGPWSATATARTEAIPTTFSRVVFVGASIINDLYGSDLSTRNSAAEVAFATAGASVEVYSTAADGEDTAATAQRLTDAMAAFPIDTLFFVHSGGNTVTPNRPYPGGAATLDAQMTALIDIAAIRPGTVIVSDLSFRDYDDTTAGNEAAGSKPYNDSLLLPLFTSRKDDLVSRAYYADGTPVSCLYEWTYYNRAAYLSADNIHPSTAGIPLLRSWLAERLAPVCSNAVLPAQATRLTLDVDAPVLSAPGGQASGQTAATALSVTTNEAGGTLYWGIYPEASNPTDANVLTGAGAVVSGQQAVTAAGAQTVPDQSGLSEDTSYRVWYLQDDAVSNRSALAGSAPFVTDGAAAPAAVTEIFVQYGTATATGVNTPAFRDFSANAGLTSDGPFDLLNRDGSNPGVQLRLNYSAPSSGDANGFGLNPFGRSTGVSGFDDTLYNDTFTTDSFYVGAANTLEHVISGLAPDTVYQVDLVASRATTGSRETLYSFASGQTATLETTADPVEAPVSVTAVSDTSGEIAFTQSANTGSWSYLSGLRILPAPAVPDVFSLEETGAEPVITANNGLVSVTLASGPYAGTYSARATDGAPLSVAMIEAAPTPIVLPVLTGTQTAGQTLTVTPGLWLYDGPDPGDQTWAWQNDTDGATGETGLSYLVQPSDAGDTIFVEETFGGVTVTNGAADASGFDPYADDAGLIHAWDASDTGSITGSPSVTQVEDRVGSLDLVAYGTPQTGTRTQNGRNTIDIPGTTSGLKVSAGNAFAGRDIAFHGMVVWDGAGASTNPEWEGILGMDDNANALYALNLRNGNSGSDAEFDGEVQHFNGTIGTTSALTGGPYSGAFTWSLIYDDTAGTWQAYINGVQRASGTLAAGLPADLKLVWGGPSGENFATDQAVCELLVTTSITTPAEYHDYLSAKWTP